jgi:hypothetical protein
MTQNEFMAHGLGLFCEYDKKAVERAMAKVSTEKSEGKR